jgi:hypothetical protein
MTALPRLPFDFKNPDYAAVLKARMVNLRRLREQPETFKQLRAYYAAGHYADFINDWGVTFDPRNAERGLPTLIPFVLFPKQREWIDYVLRKWRAQEPGLCEKSRDMGVSWLAMALSCTLCLFNDGVVIGVGSRKTIYVDKVGEHKPLLPKARIFMENLPAEFRGDWQAWRDAPNMRVMFPATGSLISGEGGDDIGRGDRTSIYFVDEAAHLEHPEKVDAALSQTTNCRIDMSSVRGMANPFAKKRWGGKIEPFIFDWRDDPRKDDAWYKKQCETLDPVVVAQEIDRDYLASVKGVVIPGTWVRSAIGAKRKLGIAPSGIKRIAFDVADEGDDLDAVCVAEGTTVLFTDEWSGKGGDVFESTELVFDYCDEHGVTEFRYDADGIGAGVRGDARVINERRKAANARPIRAVGYRGSEAVFNPDGIVEGTIGLEGDKGRTNKDYFANRKAQAWWGLRKRFQRTHRWVTQGIACPPDDIIDLDDSKDAAGNARNPMLMKLVAELSQATYRTNELGKIVIEKKPSGVKSPNLADAVVIDFAEMESGPVEITSQMLLQIASGGRSRRR